MTLTELRYLVALHSTGHFGKAAERCFVSQPTLSIAIKKLEEELQVALFERSRNQVRPTALGERIVQQAKQVLDQAQVIRELAEEGKDPLGSTLSIGAIYTIGPYLFPHCLPELQRLAPQMPLYLEENYTASLREKLRSGQLDAIIVALPFTEPDVVTQVLYDEPLVVLLRHDHPLAQTAEIDPAQLANEAVLLLGEGHCLREQILDACPAIRQSMSAQEARLQSVVEGSSLETLKHMVASGLGITILPLSAAGLGTYANGLLTSRPLKNPPRRTVALAWRASFPRHQAIDILSSAVRQCRLAKPEG